MIGLFMESSRYMRLLVFFDLPILSSKQKKEYRRFHHFLEEDGYVMLQESVYSRLVMNYGASELAVARLRLNRPLEGSVECLIVTEKQFASIEFITGASSSKRVDNTERVIII